MKHTSRLFSILISLFLLINISSKAQKTEENVFKKGTDEYKMFMARQDFFGGDYRSAVNKYKEVLKNRPNDASVHFFIGECYYMMREYESSLDELEKAKSISATAHSDLALVLGKSLHMNGKIDRAIAELTAYKTSLGNNIKRIQETEVDIHVAQCNVAKQLMTKPLDIKVIHLLDLNSQFDDKGPVLTNADKTMIFTSRRPSDDKAKGDDEGDFGFYDDVYESFWSDEKKTWLAAEMIRGPINTEYYDACNSISADGTMMFLYRNSPSEARGGEIFMSKKATSGKWKSPEVFLKPVNTTYYEDAACISPDGNTLYFVSERPGGLGRGDIWTSKKGVDGAWAEPVNAGAPLNSDMDENGLYLIPDGKTLFFCSNNSLSMGSYDIFKTTLGSDGKWTSPVNMGYPINTVLMETKFVLTADKKTAYISSVRDTGLGERDIFMLDLSSYDVLSGSAVQSAPQSASVKGMISDEAGTVISAEVKITDKASGTLVKSLKSGADGVYSTELSPDKTYIFEVAQDGFQKISEEITITAGQAQSRNFILKK